MSLPDTVFIFVLALIIFGPKKLPEIGRQLGRLVGEFRRASNEFKFQIEEELRQVDFNEKRGSQQTIAASVDDTAQIADTTDPIFPQDSEDATENIAVGQHPNIDTLDTSELNPSEMYLPEVGDSDSEAADVGIASKKTSSEIYVEPSAETSVPVITPAANIEARTTVPYAATESDNDSLSLPFPQQTVDDTLPPPEMPAPTNSHSHAAPNEAEITHG